MKKININGKEFEIQCNAFTRFQYKKIFGHGIFQDINSLQKFISIQNDVNERAKKEKLSEEKVNELLSNEMMEILDDFIDVITQLAYILILSANEKTEDYETWLKNIEKIDLSESWVSEVTETVVNSFC